MEHYKILGVDKNTSMEEITKAYEDRINKFKEEIEDEKRAKSFIKVFDEAYEKIKEEREKNKSQQTVIIDNQVKDLNNNFHKNDSNSYESFNEYEQEFTVSKEKERSSSKSTSIRKQKKI